MGNVISLEEFGYKPSVPERINIETFIYIIKSGGHTSTTTNKEIPQDLIDTVKKYLLDEHKELIQESFGDEVKKKALRGVVSQFITSQPNIEGFTLEQLAKGIVDAVAGLDVLEPFAEQDTVTDIICNNWDEIWIKDLEKGDYLSNVTFKSKEAYLALCNKFVNASGQTWTHSKPKCDAYFPNMRINLVGFDISKYGVSLAIRIFGKTLRINDEIIVEEGLASKEMLPFFKAMMRSRSRILISGETGSGKTEFMKYLLGKKVKTDKTLVLQDVDEMNLKQIYSKEWNLSTWLTREREDSSTSVTYEDLLSGVVRQTIKIICINELRGREAWGAKKLAETGHGILTSLHSPSSADSVERYSSMCLEAVNISKEYLQQSIALNFDYGMHFELMLDGKRRLTEIVEYIGYENGKLIYTPLYLFNVKEIKEFQDEHDQTKFIINGSHERVGKLSDRMIKKLKFKGIKTSELEVAKELPIVKEGEKLIGIS
ncbi:ATPase, T2SS/T4P/T4SS family [Bacillus cereus]|nr:ATPase, T2SS/T4P/T4SS family [Bacillus cereus]MDA2129758.1 ATPase, T2SS/T4P/T4SS family [Bacillus cereus]MDA2152192.1 ATPase, T2SS/T4P/T4SS family [Bacillus cereus]MEB8550893.1 ATPase, T2SS/T4P/T4SS family [Bacillus cereus]MEB8729204.1 ATPase, T2SS/T4P/T4SS family [Bacillus cereus]